MVVLYVLLICLIDSSYTFNSSVGVEANANANPADVDVDSLLLSGWVGSYLMQV